MSVADSQRSFNLQTESGNVALVRFEIDYEVIKRLPEVALLKGDPANSPVWYARSETLL